MAPSVYTADAAPLEAVRSWPLVSTLQMLHWQSVRLSCSSTAWNNEWQIEGMLGCCNSPTLRVVSPSALL
jgi:hypothetical protein